MRHHTRSRSGNARTVHLPAAPPPSRPIPIVVLLATLMVEVVAGAPVTAEDRAAYTCTTIDSTAYAGTTRDRATSPASTTDTATSSSSSRETTASSSTRSESTEATGTTGGRTGYPPTSGDTGEYPEYGSDGKDTEPRDEGPTPEPSGGFPLDPSLKPVGTLEGRFDVTPGGSASYSIPIVVPPGTRNIEPRISISYNSHAGNGLVGVGFDIGGLSSIQRCAPTLAQDGYVDGINLDKGDRFCLDGLRLVLVEGKYGAAKSKYHTEGETGSLIEAKGTCGDGPCYFTLTRKDGFQIEFGGEGSNTCNTLGGDKEPSSTRVSWPMARLTDLNGNYLSVTWEPAGQRRCAPSRIDYTGNVSQEQQPLRMVTFDYEGRTDIERHYGSGLLFTLEKRLKAVHTWIHPAEDPKANEKVRSYNLEYAYGAHTFRSRLTSITGCAADGSCLPPTVFSWQDGAWLTSSETVEDPGSLYFEPAPSYDLAYVGDFDASGRADYLEFLDDVDGDGMRTAIELDDRDSQVTPLFDMEAWLTAHVDPAYGERFYMADVNADGASDLLILGDEDLNGWNGYRVYPGGPNGLSHNYTLSGAQPSLEDLLIVADFTGDGRTDALAFDNPVNRHNPWYEGWRLYQWNDDAFQFVADGTFSPPDTSLPDEMEDWDASGDQQVRYFPGDFNGDGRVDLLGAHRIYYDDTYSANEGADSYTEWKMLTSTGIGFDLIAEGAWPGDPLDIVTADFNGDGLTDVILNEPSTWFKSGGYTLLFSTGMGLEPVFNIPANETIMFKEQNWDEHGTPIDWGYTGEYPNSWYKIHAADLNDDGRSDLIAVLNGEIDLENAYQPPPPELENYIKLFVSDGHELVEVDPLYHYFGADYLLADFYGHGMTSILRYAAEDAVFNYTPTWQKPDLLNTVTDGVKGSILLEYLPMVYDLVYTKGTGASYPERDFRASRYLVRSVHRGDGAGNSYTSWYKYEGARTDLTGRGFLGFSSITVDNTYDGTTLVTEYRQDFPYAGALSTQERWYGGELLSKTDYEFVNQPWKGVPDTFQVLKSGETTTLYDAGIAVSMAIKSMKYDDYGNLEELVDIGATSEPWSTLVTTTTYHNDPAKWQFGYPLETTLKDDVGKVLSRKKVEYDGRMRVKFEGSWDDVHAKWIGTSQTWDDFGNPLTSTDPSGNVSEFTWDHYQFLDTAKNPKGHVIDRDFDPRFGEETVRIDENDNTTTTALDGFGRTVSITGPDLSGAPVVLQRFSFADVGYGVVSQSFVRRDWGADEWDWKESYKDGLGREYKTRRRGEGSSAIAIDRVFAGLDLVYQVTRPYFEGQTPQWSTYLFDARRRPTLVMLPGGIPIETVYDDVANTVTRIDPNGVQTVQELNSRGKRIRLIDALGKESTFSYDPLGRVTQAVDPNGNSTVTVWDLMGRRKTVTDTQAGLTTFTYDAFGHLESEEDAKHQRIERDYDELDRTTFKRFYAAGALTPSREVELEYDDASLTNSLGRLSHVRITQDGQLESSYSLGYDPYGRQTGAVMEIGGRTFGWSESYDPSGVRESAIYPDGSELKIDHTSGGNLRLVSVLDAINPGAGFVDHAVFGGFDPEGRPAQLQYANDVVSCYDYDVYRGVLTGARTGRFGAPDSKVCSSGAKPIDALLDYGYKWDDVNNLTDLEDLIDPSRTQSFGYNDRGELLSAKGIYGTETFDYDDAGNRTSVDGITQTYQGQQIVGNPNGLSATWDDNGNLETKTDGAHAWTYDWDVEDNLRQVDRDGEVTTYLYDFNGHRIYKKDPDGRETFYVSSLYEVTVANGVEVHTKYLPGPNGNLAQITHSGVQLAMVVESESDEQMAMLYAPTFFGTPPRLMYQALAVLTAPGFSRQAMGWLLWAIAACVVVMTGRTLREVLRAGRAARTGRRSGAAVGAGGWAVGKRSRSTRAMRRSPIFATVLPSVLGVMLVGQLLTPQTARAFGPGVNGPGVPVDGTYYITQNHIRTSVLLTDSSGKATTRLEYRPWGEVYAPASDGDDISRGKFNGREYDTGSDLYAFNERYYDPALGRFISADRSIGADPAKTVSLNRYAYAANNPVTYVDPSGRFAMVAFLVVVALVAIAGALIAGTDGKILTDPSHAFDEWSWTRAFFGFLIGMVVGVVSFGIGTIGVGVAVFGVSLNTVLVSTFAGGVLSLTMAYANGERDGGKLLAYFGIGMIAGFISGTGGLGAAGAAGNAGKLFTDIATSVATSALKKAVDPNNAMAISIWAISITIDRFNQVSFSANYAYLAGVVADFGLAHGVELEAPTFDPMTGESWGGQVESVGALHWIRETFLARDWQVRPDQVAFNLVGLVGRKVMSFAFHQWIEHSGFRTSMWDPARGLLEGDLGSEAIGGAIMGLADDAWAQHGSRGYR